MKPVFQTKFAKGEGNCFAACVASILEVPLEQVDFVADEETWLPKLNAILEPFGYRWLEINLKHSVNYPLYAMYGQICVFTGKSPRGDMNHAVVGRLNGTWEDASVTYETIHDPIPGGTGIVGGVPMLIGFPIPIAPHKMIELADALAELRDWYRQWTGLPAVRANRALAMCDDSARHQSQNRAIQSPTHHQLSEDV